MIAAIVLAAGESRRMGMQKLLLPYGNRTVIEHIVDQVLASRVGKVVVVTGNDHDAIVDALSNRPVSFVRNTDYKEGMLSSVRCGLTLVPVECDAFMVVLGDQPAITLSLVNELIASWDCGKARIIVPCFQGPSGHPVLISARLRDEILSSFDAEGLRGLLYAHPADVLRLEVSSAGAIRDMDSRDDYERELMLRGEK